MHWIALLPTLAAAWTANQPVGAPRATDWRRATRLAACAVDETAEARAAPLFSEFPPPAGGWRAAAGEAAEQQQKQSVGGSFGVGGALFPVVLFVLGYFAFDIINGAKAL